MISAICQLYNIVDGSVEIGCDGIQALIQGTLDSDITSPKYPQFDIIGGIRQTMRGCSISWKSRHVKGHQDDNVDAILDNWAILNIEMDQKAKAHWQLTHAATRPRQERIFGEPWALWIGNRKICTDIRSAIVDHLHGNAAMSYWDSKNRFGAGTSALIDWRSTEKAMKAVSPTRQRWVTKHVSGFCGSRKMLHRWKKCADAICPRCESVEDAQHVWKCQGRGANDVWEKSIEQLREWLMREKTLPIMTAMICDGLSAWRYDKEQSARTPADFGLHDAAANQDGVGWQALLEGTPATGWRDVQERYLQFIGSRRSGERWLSAVIQKLWDVAWDQWNHRNGILHDKDNSVIRSLQEEQIRKQFAQGWTTVTRDAKTLFRDGLDKTLELSAELQAGWLIRVEAARSRFLRQQDEQANTYSRERQALARWLRG
jgi:hypothetical protein